MQSVDSIKNHFKKTLKSHLSDREILSLWHKWVLKELLNISLIDSFVEKNTLIDSHKINQIQSLICHFPLLLIQTYK